MNTPGNKFRQAIADNNPLMVVGAVNAYCAKMAEKAGHKALYLSGAGVANASFGLPDLAITTLNDVAEDSRRITQATNLPLLIDIDTGFGNAINTQRTVRLIERAGACAMQLEDQVFPKKCGHFSGKAVIPVEEAVSKIKAAVDAREDANTMIIARTDARASDGLEAALGQLDGRAAEHQLLLMVRLAQQRVRLRVAHHEPPALLLVLGVARRAHPGPPRPRLPRAPPGPGRAGPGRGIRRHVPAQGYRRRGVGTPAPGDRCGVEGRCGGADNPGRSSSAGDSLDSATPARGV